MQIGENQLSGSQGYYVANSISNVIILRTNRVCANRGLGRSAPKDPLPRRAAEGGEEGQQFIICDLHKTY